MIRFSILALAFLTLSACGYRAMTPGEKVKSLTITHEMNRHDAYNASEVWIAETFVSAAAVIDVRQPEAGLIIGKSRMSGKPIYDLLVPNRAGPSADYSMKIVNDDKATTITYTLSQPFDVLDDDIQYYYKQMWDMGDELAVRLKGNVTTPRPVVEAPKTQPAPAAKPKS